MDFIASPTWPDLASAMPDCRDVYLPDLDHFIPMRDPADEGHSPLRELEHDLHQVVAFGVLPMFAFVNAGIDLRGIGLDDLFHAVPLGIAAGLFVGVGVALFAGRAIEGVLFGVQARDPAAIVGASVLLVLVAVTALVVPAVHAGRTDPVRSLREE